MAPDERHTTAAEDRVPWNQLIAYGMGGLIPIALFNIAGQLMGLLGNISLGLSAFWLGTIMIVPRLWDALSDPIIGYFSDQTRTRWGRRRPYILIGGLAVAISFVAMWWVPRGEWVREMFPSDAAYNWFQLIFILIGLLVFFTACTVFEIPHGALGMELSSDYHERTRLFSAKSFLGNLFAMGTPWLIFFSGLEFFRGPAGDLTDGMRYVSMFIAAALIPMTFWWFVVLKEPIFVATAKEQPKSNFWTDMSTTVRNKSFMSLVAIIFTLAMGFNFVSIFNYYITIFYIYGGDAVKAGTLLGVNGTVWAVTGLLAVFPLNWISRSIGKNKTLLLSILLMCAAQISKIECYNPELPYLALIPTVLLSMGMLMFFTLGSSMVADVCDEDELNTGKRSEGTYYSVNWWFIKMGTAFASFVTGALLVFTQFDETQNVKVDVLSSNVAAIKSEANRWLSSEVNSAERIAKFDELLGKVKTEADALAGRFRERIDRQTGEVVHTKVLAQDLESMRSRIATLQGNREKLAAEPQLLATAADELAGQISLLRRQSPLTLFRLRFVEIGLPLALSVISIVLTLRYPLTEARCYEIKEILKQRREAGTAQ
jgi:glycoside/pentoside/hexuronide:cation symporter, GPH family